MQNLPDSLTKSLALLGENLRTARVRRKEGMEQFADRIGVTRQTLAAMESGVPTVTIGTYAMALWAIGMENDLSEIAHPDRDTQGKVAERESAPQRVRSSTPGESDRYNF